MPTRAPAKRGAKPKGAFRLPPDIRPTHYQIHIEPDLEAGTFSGQAAIEITLERPADRVFLHAVDLELRNAVLRWGRDQEDVEVLPRPKDEVVEIRLPRRMAAGKTRIAFDFTGVLQKSLRGFYGATSEGRRYGFTQLEATDARRFFPCFDEPSFKARFTFSVTTEERNAVISNSPIEREERLPDGRKRVQFAATPKLSTYLCALCVGELEASE